MNYDGCEGLVWVGDNRRGHFEVDGVRTEVPEDATLAETHERLVGRTILSVSEWDDAYYARLDDGQLVELWGVWFNDGSAGVGIRFWNDPQNPPDFAPPKTPDEQGVQG